MKTQAELIADAVVIKTETVSKANTATRVGTTLENLAKALVPVIGYEADGVNAYEVTVTDDFTEYIDNAHFKIKFTDGNTSACTLDVNELGPKSIRKFEPGSGLVPLVSGDIQDGQILEVAYDGTQFQIIGSGGGVSSLSIQTWAFPGGTLPAYADVLYIATADYQTLGDPTGYIPTGAWFIATSTPTVFADFYIKL